MFRARTSGRINQRRRYGCFLAVYVSPVAVAVKVNLRTVGQQHLIAF